MILTVKYGRRNFFGELRYENDTIYDPEYKYILKAFESLSKRHDFAVTLIDGTDCNNYFWNNVLDFENKIVSVGTFNECGRETDIFHFEIVKKEVCDRYRAE